MNDYSELKRMAEAATQGKWSRDTRKFGGVVYGGPVQHWVNGSGQSQIAMTTGSEWMLPGETEANADFIASANPTAILALIAENELLSTKISAIHSSANRWEAGYDEGRRMGTKTALAERDQLKAENEALHKDAERYRWLRDKSESIHQFYLSVPIWFSGVRFRAVDVDNAINVMISGEPRDE